MWMAGSVSTGTGRRGRESKWCEEEEHTGKPSPTRLWPVALQGTERKSRGGEERTSMWKGKEEDSKGTEADVQKAVPANSIFAFPALLEPVLSITSFNHLCLSLL